ncbi:Response regulator receiver domain-containing protein [Gammaproteobacteria bacterium]
MSTPRLIRLDPEDLRDNEPVPYDIVTAEGVLLLAKGNVLVPKQAAILRIQGWKLSDGVIPDEITDHNLPKLPATLHLPSRGRPPLNMAEVLIADDMSLVCKMLTSMLREHGIMKVESVENGLQAISYFFNNQPHIVFLDINMPSLDGLSALKQIKRWTPDCFVCIVSANSTLVNVKQAKADGVDAFLVKPINMLNLKRVLALYQKSIELIEANS